MSHAEPSLSITSLPRKAVAMAFGNKVLVARFPLDEVFKPSPFNSVIVEESQIVRAVRFLKIPDGPLCLVTAGDQKYINVYNVSSHKKDNPDAAVDSDDEGEQYQTKKKEAEKKQWKPAFTFGPHAKRIVALTCTEDGSIIFGDKFGEVYRLMLGWSPEHKIEVIGDKKSPLKPLLQHFSTLTTLFLSSPVPRLENIAHTEDIENQECRRLFTGDKDNHVRVSRYPETYSIEQYLWNGKKNHAPMTCVCEIPFIYEEDAHTHTNTSNGKSGNKNNKNFNANLSYYATGDAKGRVSFWAAYNDVPHNDPEEPFNLITTFHPHQRNEAKFNYILQHDEKAQKDADEERTKDLAKDYGAVISVVYVHLNQADQHELHPRDFVRGVLIAYEKSPDIFFLPFYELGEFSLHPAAVEQARLTLPCCPVGMVKSNNNTAMVLLRDGTTRFIGLRQKAKEANAEPKKICSYLSNVDAEFREWSLRMTFFEEKIQSVMCQPVSGGSATQLQETSASRGRGRSKSTTAPATTGKTQLEALDLFAHWKIEVDDPRNRKRTGEESSNSADDEGEEEGGGENDVSASQKKTKKPRKE